MPQNLICILKPRLKTPPITASILAQLPIIFTFRFEVGYSRYLSISLLFNTFHFICFLLLVLGLIYAFFCQKDYYPAYRKWNNLQALYQSQAYASIADDYLELASRLPHKPEVLFEAAQCQSKTGNPQEAIRLLKRAVCLSADPMIHYMLAKNEQAMHHYQDAEKTLRYALRILPERIYPYYLLVQLYADPDYYQPEKLKAMADSVLTKEPKVNSTAIREMRENVRHLLLK